MLELKDVIDEEEENLDHGLASIFANGILQGAGEKERAKANLDNILVHLGVSSRMVKQSLACLDKFI